MPKRPMDWSAGRFLLIAKKKIQPFGGALAGG
jgi:hypothetical protein